MTVTDLEKFVEDYLRLHHAEWFDHPQTFEAHYQGGRLRCGISVLDLVDQSVIISTLPVFLKNLERYDDLRMRHIRWRDGYFNIVFSAKDTGVLDRKE